MSRRVNCRHGSDAARCIVARENFHNSTRNLRGEWGVNGYRVMSYATPLLQVTQGVWWVNDTHYSVTTGRHQGVVRWALALAGIDDDHVVHVVHVPRGASTLAAYAGARARARAASLGALYMPPVKPARVAVPIVPACPLCRLVGATCVVCQVRS